MLWKRIAILTAAGAAFGAGAPAFADPPYWEQAQGYRNQHRGPKAIAVYPRPFAAVRPARAAFYRAPEHYAPQYYAPPPAHRAPAYYGPPPAPAYRGYRSYSNGGVLAGAVAGALIGGSVGHGDQRVAAIAIGSLVGAVIGHELAGGH